MTTETAVDRTVRVNGLNLHYLDWGGPAERPLILVHGLSGNAHTWDSFAPRWSRDFHVIALDQRGHGDSDHTLEGYHVQSFASDIYELAKSLGFDRFDFLGHSLGARNGIAFAGDHSEMLRNLILVDCGPEVGVTGVKGVTQRTRSRPTSFRDEAEAEAYFAETSPTWSAEYRRQNVEHALRTNWAGKLVWKYDPDILWITGGAGLREVPYLWEQCSKITCRTLVMRGETSEILPRDTVQRMLSVMSDARTVEIAGAGHSIYVDQPERFEESVIAFLREEGDR